MEGGAQDSGVETEFDLESNDSSMSSLSVGGAAALSASGACSDQAGSPSPRPAPLSPGSAHTPGPSGKADHTPLDSDHAPQADHTHMDSDHTPLESDGSALSPGRRQEPDSSDTGSMPLPPLPAAEDGYLGDCSSDGGNEKNFPMPPDRINKPMSCSCHPSRFSLPPSPSPVHVDTSPPSSSQPTITEEIEPPAGLHFSSLQGLPMDFPSLPTTGYGYQLLNHKDCPTTLRTKIRASGFRSKYNANVQDDWTRVKAAIAERKLRIAANMNNTELVDKLLANGANVRCEDDHKRTALHFAAAKGYTDVVDLLLRHGADPNQKDMLGNTALHLAACTNHVPTVTLLLRAGTDITTLDNNGKTPLQLAQAKLKILQRNTCPNTEVSQVKAEVGAVLEMMREYLSRCNGKTSQQPAWDKDVCSQLIDSFSQRLTLHTTHNDLNTDLRHLLDSLGSLSINQAETPL